MISPSPGNSFAIRPHMPFFVLMLVASIAVGDDTLTEDLESKMARLLDDHEFGLSSYASEASLEIESSPDSLHWVQGDAKFTYFLNDQQEFRHADWDLKPIDDSRGMMIDEATGLPFVPRLFDFTTCSRSMLKYRGIFYDFDRLNQQGVESEWQITADRMRQSSCVAIEPMNWPFIYTTALTRGRDQQKSMFSNRFQSNFCARAVQTDSRTTETVWFSKKTTPDGHRLVFMNITFKDELPAVVETLFSQAGFRDINDLPDRKKCRLSSIVETSWTKIDEVPLPEKVVARLQNSGFEEVKELILNVKLKYWSPGSKEYETIKSFADKAVTEIEKLEAQKK